MTDEYSITWIESGLEPQDRVEGGKQIEYCVPTTLEEAERLKNREKRYQYFAGGTILNWKGSPRAKGLIDLKHLHLSNIEVTPSKGMIGATATIQDIAAHNDLPEALTKAAKLFTSRNIRNMATAGGTATGNFFVSNVLPVFVAFKAEIEYFQEGKKHIIPIAMWLRKKPGLICSIIIKNLQRQVRFKQEKIAKMDFPLIVTSIGFEQAEKKVVEPVVAISGATGKLVISESGAGYLAGKQLSDIDVETFNTAVQNDVEPTGTVKATPRVKRRIIESHVKGIIAEFKKEGKE